MSDLGNWTIPVEEIPVCIEELTSAIYDEPHDGMCEHDHMVTVTVNGTLYAYGSYDQWVELSSLYVKLEYKTARPVVFQDGFNRWEKYPGQMRKHCMVYP
jgi:hypothetical protein